MATNFRVSVGDSLERTGIWKHVGSAARLSGAISLGKSNLRISGRKFIRINNERSRVDAIYNAAGEEMIIAVKPFTDWNRS